MASEIVLWTKRHSVCLSARYIPGRKNILADQFGRPDQVLPMEWSLLPRVFEWICSVLGDPHVYLFATWVNTKLPLYASSVPDTMAWKQVAFQHPMDHLYSCAFPLFEGSVKGFRPNQPLIDPASCAVSPEGVVHRPSVFAS